MTWPSRSGDTRASSSVRTGDPLVRVAASLKSRTSPAHVVLARARRQLRSTREGASGARTHTQDDPYPSVPPRREASRAGCNSNSTEASHGTTSRAASSSRTAALSAAATNRGAFRSGDYAEIMNKVSALSVLSNAVLVWNTVRIGGIVEELAEAGHPLLANQRDVGDAVKERLEAAVPRRAVELALLNPEALAVGRRCPAVSPHAGELEPVVVVNEGAVGRLERLGTQAPPKPRSTFTEIFAVSHAWFWVGFLRHP